MFVRIFVIPLLALCSVATNAAAQDVVFCMKPWAVPDKWIDNHNASTDHRWMPDATFETVDAHGNLLTDADVYLPPSDVSFGTGFRIPDDLGQLLTLKVGDPQDGMKSGWLYPVETSAAGGGAGNYRTTIATCEPTTVRIGDRLQPLTGNMKGPTVQGVADLINLDPNAFWDAASNGVFGSCAPGVCGSISPRIVAVALFDPAVFEASVINGGQPDLVVRNIFAVFIDGVVGGKVTGYLVGYPYPLR